MRPISASSFHSLPRLSFSPTWLPPSLFWQDQHHYDHSFSERSFSSSRSASLSSALCLCLLLPRSIPLKPWSLSFSPSSFSTAAPAPSLQQRQQVEQKEQMHGVHGVARHHHCHPRRPVVVAASVRHTPAAGLLDQSTEEKKFSTKKKGQQSSECVRMCMCISAYDMMHCYAAVCLHHVSWSARERGNSRRLRLCSSYTTYFLFKTSTRHHPLSMGHIVVFFKMGWAC